MRKIIKRILCSVLLVSFAIFTFSFARVNAETFDVNVDLSGGEYNNGSITWNFSLDENNVGSIVQSKNNGSNVNSDYKAAPRVYRQNVLTFTCKSGYKFRSITIEYNGSYTGSGIIVGTQYDNNNKLVTENSTDLTVNLSNPTGYHVINVNSEASISEIFLQNGTASSTNIQLRITSISLKVELSSVPSVQINGEANAMISVEKQFIAEKNLIDDEVVWSSSDTEVATIDSNGLLQPLSMGKTTITATAGEYTSSKQVMVFPNNSSLITVQEAISICTELSNKEMGTTPFNYSVKGTVKEIELDSDRQFSLTDGSDSIVVFTYDHGQNENDRILVTGPLTNYNEIPQFGNKSIFSKLYTVEFNTNGGTEIGSLIDVVSGSKIQSPADPSLAGYTFDYWKYGNSEWNFDEDIVENDMTLLAIWVNDSLNILQSKLNKVSAKMSISYSYNVAQRVVSDKLLASNFTAISTTYKDFDNVSISSTASYKGNSAMNGDSIQLRSKDGSGIVTTDSGGLVEKITVVWSESTADGRTIDIYGSNSAYTSSSDLYGANKGEKIGSLVKGESTELSVKEDYQFIGIRSNSGALYVNSITIDWGGSQVISESDFKINCGIDASALEGGFDSLLDDLGDAEYGICISNPDREPVYFSSSTNSENYQYDELNSIYYSVLNLGDMLDSNKEHLNTKFIVRAYVKYDDSYIYTEDENNIKNLSLIDLVNVYLKMDEVMDIEELASELNKLKVVLEKMGYEMYTPEEA